jgi:hypothetical protein
MSRTSLRRGIIASLFLVTGCSFESTDFVGPSWGSGGARGSGVLTTESREVSGFTGVTVSGAAHLILEQSGTESLTITAEDNILPLLSSEVVDGRLLLGNRTGASISPTREIVYHVTCRDLSAVSLSGAVRADLEGVDTDELEVALSGATHLTAAGRADWQHTSASGTSRIDARDLESRTARIDVSGTAWATVRVSDSLEANASGASVIEYIGTPAVSVSVSGTAVVRQIGG